MVMQWTKTCSSMHVHRMKGHNVCTISRPPEREVRLRQLLDLPPRLPLNHQFHQAHIAILHASKGSRGAAHRE